MPNKTLETASLSVEINIRQKALGYLLDKARVEAGQLGILTGKSAFHDIARDCASLDNKARKV